MRFAIEIKQLVIVEADDRELAMKAAKDDPPRIHVASYGERFSSVKSTDKFEILSCEPFKGRTPRRRRS